MKKTIIWASLLVLAACQNKTSEPTSGQEKSDSTEFIIPETFLVQPRAFLINPAKDTILVVDNKQTEIHIPADAFVDAQGNVITTPVALEFKEYTNAAEMAFSGIPMTYKSNGEEVCFSSAGMFELTGTSNGKSVEIANDKSLDMQYGLAVNNEDINFYFLDEKTNEWQLHQEIKINGKDQPESDSIASNYTDVEVVQKKTEISIPMPEEPVKPVEANDDDDRVIRISIEDQNMPEFDAYNNVSFRVVDTCKLYRNDKQITWYDFSASKGKKKGLYEINLSGYDRNGKTIFRTYTCTPAFSGDDYDKAVKEYEQKLVSVKKEKEQRAAEIK
ncbi:MAG: hypothetical protein GC181_16575 [Bacteroidetes bacterium]|nr:hypothetical protein [Bacteroidota bacterium]